MGVNKKSPSTNRDVTIVVIEIEIGSKTYNLSLILTAFTEETVRGRVFEESYAKYKSTNEIMKINKLFPGLYSLWRLNGAEF